MRIDRYNNYNEDERLYSTGDYELDALLERAFCEGYECAQREFGLRDVATSLAGRRRTKSIRNQAARVLHANRAERDRVSDATKKIMKNKELGPDRSINSQELNYEANSKINKYWAPKKGSITPKDEGSHMKNYNDIQEKDVNRRRKIDLFNLKNQYDLLSAYNKYKFGSD